MPLAPVPPPPPQEPSDGTPFTNSVWQRWFGQLASYLRQASGAFAQLSGASFSGPVTIDSSATGDWTEHLVNTNSGQLLILTGIGGTGTNKYFRLSVAGVLEVINAAFNTSILQLTDDGHFSAPFVGQTSDEGLKQGWQAVESDFLHHLAGLKRKGRAGYFQWKVSKRDAMGLGAQSVEAFCPRVVRTDEYGIKSVEYGALAAVATVELAAEMEVVLEELLELRSKAALMEARLARLEAGFAGQGAKQ